MQSSKYGADEAQASQGKDNKDSAAAKKPPKVMNPMFEEFGTSRAPPTAFMPSPNRNTLGEADSVIQAFQNETASHKTGTSAAAATAAAVVTYSEKERSTIADVDKLIDDLESMSQSIPPPSELTGSPSSPSANASTAPKTTKTIQAIPLASRETNNGPSGAAGSAKIVPNGSARLVAKPGGAASAAMVKPQNLPSCEKCKEPVSGNSVTILSKVWHADHFQCAKCATVLSPLVYHEKDGVPYCEKDYRELFSPKCSYCSGIITDVRNIAAISSYFHFSSHRNV